MPRRDTGVALHERIGQGNGVPGVRRTEHTRVPHRGVRDKPPTHSLPQVLRQGESPVEVRVRARVGKTGSPARGGATLGWTGHCA